MRHLLTAVFGLALAGSVMAADQAPTVTPYPHDTSPQAGSSTGMSAVDEGKPADNAEVDVLDRQDRASAHQFNQDVGGTAWHEGSVGKEASPESADSIHRRQGRAGALEFNRAEHDDAMSGSSAGMDPQDATQSAGKPADRRDVDPIDQGRANALMFNKDERDLSDRQRALHEGRQDYAD